MAEISIEVASTEPAQLGECPVWAPDEQVLYWADINAQRINRLDPATGHNHTCELPGRPGSFALTSHPGVLLVAMEHEIVWLDWASGTIEPWLVVEEEGAGIRLNDGRTDPAGRFVVASMYEDTSLRRFVGSLHQIDADGTHTVLRRGVSVGNGIAFDPVRGKTYFADSPTLTVLSWNYDTETAARTEPEVFFEYGGEVTGKPDGGCVDADGHYWSASVRGWGLTRIAPDGSVERRIELPVAMPSMPAFGGPDLDQLYVTSIATDEDVREGVAHGSLLKIDLSATGITGRAEVPFAGQVPAALGASQ